MDISARMDHRDWDGFQAVQFKAFDAAWDVWEEFSAKTGRLPADVLEAALAAQEAASAAVRGWAAGGRMGPGPSRGRPFGGAAGEFMAEYRSAVKSAYLSACGSVYSCLPQAMFPDGAPDRLGLSYGQVPLHGDRIVDGAFAASGPSVMDYALRAAAGTGLAVEGQDVDGRSAVRVGRDPVARFYPSGGCLFDKPAVMLEVDVEDMEPEACLVRGPDGRILPGTFGGEWTSSGERGPAVARAVLVTGLPSEYFEHVRVMAGGRCLDGRRLAAMKGNLPDVSPAADGPGLSL